jgi:hypothetical protein
MGDSRAGSLVGASDASVGAAVIPVVAAWDNVRASEIVAREAEVVGAQRAVAVLHGAEVRANARVVSDTTTGGTSKIAAEAVHAGVELLEDNGLGLYFADLLTDNAFGHLLEDKKALLDDLNAFRVADNLLLFYDSDRAFTEMAVVKIVGAVKVVKATE